ncbi:hypothetical protein GCM10009599_18240 [Luteococcus peritonei]
MLAESAVSQGLITLDDLRCTLSARASARRAIDALDRGESGTETLVRLRLRARGVRLRTQVEIAGVGRVDLLVGDRLVIEVDSRAHHTGAENYANDRRRDLVLRSKGYVVVRLTLAQVMHDWPAVEQHLLAMIRRGDHRWPRRRRAS